MKNMLKKIKINPLTYFLLLICSFTGMFKNISLIMLIVIIHELGHMFFINWFNYHINKCEIYPFGGITEVEKDLNSPINHDLLIASGGFLFQVILMLIFLLLYRSNVISALTLKMFNNYNLAIIIFNLLPIVPLDGYVIVKCLFEKIFTFKMSHYLVVVISLISIVFYIQYNYVYSVNNYMIVTLLIYKTYEYLKNYKYIYNRFLLERYMNIYPYRKTKEEKKISFKNFRKETLHFFKVGNKYVHEREILKDLFDKNRHF